MTFRDLVESWRASAEPLTQLVDELEAIDVSTNPEALGRLAIQFSRSVLVNPSQTIGDVNKLLDRIVAVRTPEGRLAALDILNALACAGAQIWPGFESALGSDLGELVQVGPPLALRLHVAFAALIYQNIEISEQIAPCVPETIDEAFDNIAFPNDILALLGHLIVLVRHLKRQSNDKSIALRFFPAWHQVIQDLPELYASEQLDESMLLWLGRLIYEQIDDHPTSRVAALVANDLHRVPSAEASKARFIPSFPSEYETLGGGAYRVERHLQGRVHQTMWTGREIETNDVVFIACNAYNSHKHDVATLRRILDYRAPGIFELAHIGTFDILYDENLRERKREHLRRCFRVYQNDLDDDEVEYLLTEGERHWAIVERVPPGSWLPHVLGAADPWKAPAKAIHLGRTAGRILLGAIAAGIDVSRVRPEVMWADKRNGRLEVTGLSPRAIRLFDHRVGEQFVLLPYSRYYDAPEAPEVDQPGAMDVRPPRLAPELEARIRAFGALAREPGVRNPSLGESLNDLMRQLEYSRSQPLKPPPAPDDRAVAYSLAVMIAEWASGRYPFKGNDGREIWQAGHVSLDLPRPLATLLEATIRLDPNVRPRLAEFVEQLERL